MIARLSGKIFRVVVFRVDGIRNVVHEILTLDFAKMIQGTMSCLYPRVDIEDEFLPLPIGNPLSCHSHAGAESGA
jgi:hypothetical protein